MKDFLKKLLGINEIELKLAEATRLKDEAERTLDLIKEKEKDSLSPKELAIANNEAWVGVIQTHVNKENVRNGFFELDWNDQFIVQLKNAGYSGSSDEEIVDKWFQELCKQVGSESDIDMDKRGSGYVNRALRDDGKTEVF